MKRQDRYEHRESKAPVVVVDTFADRAGFGYDTVTYAFACDAGNGFVYTVPVAEFRKWYTPIKSQK